MWKNLLNIWKEDNLMDQAWEQSYKMLAIDHEMFLEALIVLRETDDTNVPEEIREKDKIVNQYEKEVRRKVVTHCSVQGQQTFTGGLVLVSIIHDIERIGDYTKNIVDLAMNYPEKLHGGKFEDDLHKVENTVKTEFIKTRECIESSDEKAALTVLQEYKWLSRLCDQKLMELIKMTEPEIKVGTAVSLGLYFRWLKRIHGHLRNITTSVVNPFDMIGFQPKTDDN